MSGYIHNICNIHNVCNVPMLFMMLSNIPAILSQQILRMKLHSININKPKIEQIFAIGQRQCHSPESFRGLYWNEIKIYELFFMSVVRNRNWKIGKSVNKKQKKKKKRNQKYDRLSLPAQNNSKIGEQNRQKDLWFFFSFFVVSRGFSKRINGRKK